MGGCALYKTCRLQSHIDPRNPEPLFLCLLKRYWKRIFNIHLFSCSENRTPFCFILFISLFFKQIISLRSKSDLFSVLMDSYAGCWSVCKCARKMEGDKIVRNNGDKIVLWSLTGGPETILLSPGNPRNPVHPRVALEILGFGRRDSPVMTGRHSSPPEVTELRLTLWCHVL